MLEKALISAVVHMREEPVYRVSGLEPARLFGALAEAASTSTRSSRQGPRSSSPRRSRTRPIRAARWTRSPPTGARSDDLGKVSVIGAGMKSHPGVAAKTFATLEREGIAPAVVSTSPIKIACHVPDSTRSTVPCRRSTRRSSLANAARIGVVGGTGAVGTVTLGLLRQHGFEDVRVFASARSAGKQVAG